MRLEEQSTQSSSSTNNNNEQQQLSLSYALEFDQVQFNSVHQLFGMASIKAPLYESEERKSRAPLDLICVIDKSGSMEGTKIELVKQTLSFVIDQLKNEDRISLIEFDNDVNTLINLTNMNEFGKEKAKKSVDGIKVGTTTNISGAILQAFDVLRNRNNPSSVSSIILFTDGLPTKGITDSNKIKLMVEKFMNSYITNNSTSFFTLGFGNEHNANLLTTISQIGGGLYYYIEKEDKIGEAFIDILGGLVSVVAQQIVLKFKVKHDNVKFKGIINSGYNPQVMIEGKEVHLRLGDLYSEEERDIIFQLELGNEQGGIEKQELLDLTLEYFNVIATELEKKEETVIVCRSESTRNLNGLGFHKEIDKQRNRITSADAISKARELADQNKLTEARNVLEEAIEKIQKSRSSEDTFCQGLIKDLKDCLVEMRSEESYHTVGNKVLNTHWCSAVQQRSNTRSTNYENSHKKALKAKMVHFNVSK
ncbi:hypothetical protein ABK040_010966 [Willaertia magna]